MKPSDNDMPPADATPPAKDEFEQVVDKLREANNILVTVSTDPTVDQFAACIGLTLILNKLGKHANAVFSGKVPSTIDFLKPEKTLEKDTNSLRDFIIALDKSKADKLRYKVENDVVKIFITPYKTSISEKDLQFSEGDFNVDAVVALGVQDKTHIDQAILAHGRILHDASVVSINIDKQSRLGNINWSDDRASSLCEMVADVAIELDNNVFDAQNSTALLTGIVAETDRYSNEKAAPHTMSVAGLLMSAGASTQLVSSQLGAKHTDHVAAGQGEEVHAEEDGVLEIDHQPEDKKDENPPLPPIPESPPQDEHDDIPPPPADLLAGTSHPEDVLDSPEPPKDSSDTDKPEAAKPKTIGKSRVMHEPPEFSGQLTANSEPEDARYPGNTDPLSNVPQTPLLSHSDGRAPAKAKTLPDIDDDQTLSDIEKAVDSPHIDEHSVTGSTADTDLEGARDAVMQAEAESDMENPRPEALQSMGSTELGSDYNSTGIPPESATLDPSASKDTPPPPVPPPYLPPNS